MIVNEESLAGAADLFKALSATSRLLILSALAREPSSVSALTEATRLSQPLVSQHLRLLRGINLVTPARSGREIIYSLTDDHVARVIQDAIAHSQERQTHSFSRLAEEDIMTEEIQAEHTLTEHQHGGPDCTHLTVQHGDHVDYLHEGHRHAEHEGHYDEHDDPAEHTPAEHQHGGPDCTHETVQHGDHVDYLHDGHKHAEHEGHYDEH